MHRRQAALVIAFVAIAAAVLGARAQESPTPVWATPDRFWFRVAVQGGNEWWMVDARTGMRDRLFDHRRLAIEISAQTNDDFSALTLPFADPATAFVVKYDGETNALRDGLALEFTLADKRWRCELNGEWDWARKSDYYCAALEADAATAPGPEGPVVSPDGKWEAAIQNNNVTVSQAGGATRVLSTDGSATSPYYLGSLHWSGDSRTLSGYRVHSDAWRNPSPGIVKTFVSQQQWTVAKQALANRPGATQLVSLTARRASPTNRFPRLRATFRKPTASWPG